MSGQQRCPECGETRCWHRGQKPPDDPFRFTGFYMGWRWEKGKPIEKAPPVGI